MPLSSPGFENRKEEETKEHLNKHLLFDKEPVF